MDIATILGLLAQAGLSVYGETQGAALDAASRERLERILREYEGLEVPELQSLSAEQLGRPSSADVRADPALEATQRAMLAKLAGLSEQGFDVTDEAALNRSFSEAQGLAAGQRASIEREMAARGQLGGGAEWALKAQGAADASDRAAQAAKDRQAMMLQRRLQAMAQASDVSGAMRSQDVSEKSRRAAALDEVERYNAGARESTARYNATLPERAYQMQLQKLAGKSGQSGSLASLDRSDASNARDLYSGLGAAAYEAGRASSRRDPYARDPYGVERDELLYGKAIGRGTR